MRSFELPWPPLPFTLSLTSRVLYIETRRCAPTPTKRSVFDGDVWRSQLPDLIEAIFFPSNWATGSGTGRVDLGVDEGDARGWAWGLKGAFAARFPGHQLPVFAFDQDAAERGIAPFAES